MFQLCIRHNCTSDMRKLTKDRHAPKRMCRKIETIFQKEVKTRIRKHLLSGEVNLVKRVNAGRCTKRQAPRQVVTPFAWLHREPENSVFAAIRMDGHLLLRALLFSTPNCTLTAKGVFSLLSPRHHGRRSPKTKILERLAPVSKCIGQSVQIRGTFSLLLIPLRPLQAFSLLLT